MYDIMCVVNAVSVKSGRDPSLVIEYGVYCIPYIFCGTLLSPLNSEIIGSQFYDKLRLRANDIVESFAYGI